MASFTVLVWDHVLTLSDEVCWPHGVNVFTRRSERTHRLSICGRGERGWVSAVLAFDCTGCSKRIAFSRLPLFLGQSPIFAMHCCSSRLILPSIRTIFIPQNRYLIPLSFIVNLWAYFSASLSPSVSRLLQQFENREFLTSRLLVNASRKHIFGFWRSGEMPN